MFSQLLNMLNIYLPIRVNICLVLLHLLMSQNFMHFDVFLKVPLASYVDYDTEIISAVDTHLFSHSIWTTEVASRWTGSFKHRFCFNPWAKTLWVFQWHCLECSPRPWAGDTNIVWISSWKNSMSEHSVDKREWTTFLLCCAHLWTSKCSCFSLVCLLESPWSQ